VIRQLERPLRLALVALILTASSLGQRGGIPAQEPPPPPEPAPQEQPQNPPPPPPEDVPAQPPPPDSATPETGTPPTETAPESLVPPPPPKPRSKRRLTIQEKHDELERKLAALVPRGTYILIDTGINHLMLMKDQKVVREAVCSTGSGRFLPDPPRNREWTFDTPKGEFRIQKKIVKPVWIKPDWAFIEDGEDLPRTANEREAPDELGDYAMDLGDGYLIHGTLYERSLGMSVTHGCVRLGAKDLEAIFQAVKVGTPVYIF